MRSALAAAVLAAAAGCIVEPIELDDRKCDEEHPCVENYFCNDDGICILEEDDDSGSSSD